MIWKLRSIHSSNEELTLFRQRRKDKPQKRMDLQVVNNIDHLLLLASNPHLPLKTMVGLAMAVVASEVAEA